ncbi:heterokaryon incompatibility protein-domain-containing protein [Xylariales sp. PMI_506]|nr:heterokaryon incompatibility protein-domain-containing protein [Xylariales sp. PMI_506]
MSPSGSHAALYQHDRLTSSRSIRLLALLPSHVFADALQLSLSEVNLDSASIDQAGYEALSYVWGSRFGTIPVLCDGKQLLVTPNCESALRYLRHGDRSRILWVDSICIDQGSSTESVRERNAQIALMGEIYQKATRTLCWFGSGNDFSGELMKHLERLGSCPSQRGLKKFLQFDERLRREGRVDPESSALNYILCHPWHSRIWTVQEASFARDSQVICGKNSISWDLYSEAARFLVFEEFIEQLDTKAHRSYIAIDVRNTLRGYLRGGPPSKPDPSSDDTDDDRDQKVVFLSSCLSDINQLEATEPRDKIYGLHALYTKLGVMLPAADYTKPIADVYEGAAIAMIEWSRTLKVLGDACHGRVSFPSWVPDWSDGNIKISTPSGNATGGSKIVGSSPRVLNPRPGELCVNGKIVGRVIGWEDNTSIAAAFPTRAEQCNLSILTGEINSIVEDVETLRLWIDKVKFFRQLYRLLRTNSSITHNSGDLEDVFLDILKQDSYSDPDELFTIWLDILAYPETKYDLTSGENLVRKWKAAEQATAAHWTTELTNCAVIMAALLSNQVKHGGISLDCISGVLDLMNQFFTNLSDKALVMVSLEYPQRNALGTALYTAQEGDSVVLLEGADWPVILRTVQSKWKFISPAFITGIMDGEAWSIEDETPNQMIEFCLV